MFRDRAAQSFLEDLERSEEVQHRFLVDRIITPNAGSELGRRYQLSSVATVADYQMAVPITRYEDIRSEVERIMAGEPNLRFTEPVKRFFTTSGSTALPKYIPVTSSFIKDKSRAFGIFWSLVFGDHPRVAKGRMVTNFSDAGRSTPMGANFPVSSESAFWAEVTSATQRKESLIPKAVARIPDPTSRYYAIARILLEEDFTAIMALNPSTILLLLQTMNAHADALVRDVADGGLTKALEIHGEARTAIEARYGKNAERAAALSALLSQADSAEVRLPAARVWPQLDLAVCWRSPMLAPYLRLLETHLGGVPGRDYISMASESVLAIPLADGESGGALAVGSSFFELVPEDELDSPSPNPLLPHQAEVGGRYVVVLSNTAGLYRYDIGDVVQVKRFVGTTPVVEFLHRTGRTCSLTGEKLTEGHVTAAVEKAIEFSGIPLASFTVFPASTQGLPHYVFMVEPARPTGRDALAALRAAFDRTLSDQNIEYASKRSSRRLGGPELWAVELGAYAKWRQRRLDSGAAELQIKPVHLTRDTEAHRGFRVIERIDAG